MGRPTKYDFAVKPHLEKINEWVRAGATNEEVAKALGIATSTLCEYKTKYKELSDAFTRGRSVVVCDIKAALLKKALGFHYTEKKTFTKIDEKNGLTSYTEEVEKYCVPSETAAAMMLRNIDENYKDNDDLTVRLRKQEAELKQKIAEAKNWIE